MPNTLAIAGAVSEMTNAVVLEVFLIILAIAAAVLEMIIAVVLVVSLKTLNAVVAVSEKPIMLTILDTMVLALEIDLVD